MLSARSFDEWNVLCHGERVMTLMSNLCCWDATNAVVVDHQCIPRGFATRGKRVEVS